ncbi:glycosyltransferase family 2 protein [Paenibacillus sp. GSMTC-2017]|nr:glycosyltransferase family 2 protein [Paenibacillus sp. GSMTC-2017]
MIVKNEERWIAQCLESVLKFADEIIVVDTGSTDHTLDICNTLGVTVQHLEWNNDFAAARNYSLGLATGDWIMWLDADEQLLISEPESIRKQLEQSNENIYSIRLINYIGDHVSPHETYHYNQVRIIRNYVGLKFNNSVHETINVHEVMPELQSIDIQCLPIEIYHYGYLNNVVLAKGKSDRNIALLEASLVKEIDNPWTYYHLASEYVHLKKYELAYGYVNRAVLAFLGKNQAPPSLLYKLKYAILIEVKHIDKNTIAAIDKAIQMYPDYVDLHLYRGIMLFTDKQYDEALSTFQHCILLGESHTQHLTLAGSGSFHAWYYIGQCHEKLSDPKQAKVAYHNSINIYSDYLPSKEALLALQ